MTTHCTNHAAPLVALLSNVLPQSRRRVLGDRFPSTSQTVQLDMNSCGPQRHRSSSTHGTIPPHGHIRSAHPRSSHWNEAESCRFRRWSPSNPRYVCHGLRPHHSSRPPSSEIIEYRLQSATERAGKCTGFRIRRCAMVGKHRLWVHGLEPTDFDDRLKEAAPVAGLPRSFALFVSVELSHLCFSHQCHPPSPSCRHRHRVPRNPADSTVPWRML